MGFYAQSPVLLSAFLRLEERTKLDNIGQSVDSIRIDFKASDQRWTALSERVIRNEEIVKQAHKRIDKIENKGEF